MTKVDVVKLRELAEKSTEGPWFMDADKGGLSLIDTGRREDWVIARGMETDNARFITACDPQTILSLCARVEALEEALAAYVNSYPAFRSKPIGAPNSPARKDQETHIANEDRARALLKQE